MSVNSGHNIEISGVNIKGVKGSSLPDSGRIENEQSKELLDV
jgi:hypothetical protein